MQATLLLLGTMDEAHANQLRSEPSVKAIMDSLNRQYANRSEATLYRLLSEVINQKEKPEHNINQHIGHLKEMRAALKGIGEDIPDNLFNVIIINSLPSEYGNVLDQ